MYLCRHWHCMASGQEQGVVLKERVFAVDILFPLDRVPPLRGSHTLPPCQQT